MSSPLVVTGASGGLGSSTLAAALAVGTHFAPTTVAAPKQTAYTNLSIVDSNITGAGKNALYARALELKAESGR